MKTITLETYAGNSIGVVAKDSQRMAQKESAMVNFNFNGINVIVAPDTDIENLLRDYSTAWIMDWKSIGPYPHVEYPAYLKAEIDEKQRIREENNQKRQEELRKEEAIEKEAFDKTVAGIEMEFKDKKTWEDGLALNQDPYGNSFYVYAEGWAKLMQAEIAKGRTVQECAEETSFKLSFLGITGFMYGAAVSILSKCWLHGETLRKWHNKEYNHEGDGVVNPAIMTISVPNS